MANKPTVIVDISPAGSVKIDAQCFTGSGCAAATEHIEIALGGAGSRKKIKKPEFFAPVGMHQSNKQTF